jgi:hypothetical protein
VAAASRRGHDVRSGDALPGMLSPMLDSNRDGSIVGDAIGVRQAARRADGGIYELEPVKNGGDYSPAGRAVGANVGARRCFVACSYAYASEMSFASLHAPPMKEMPTGRPCTWPAGTVMLG